MSSKSKITPIRPIKKDTEDDFLKLRNFTIMTAEVQLKNIRRPDNVIETRMLYKDYFGEAPSADEVKCIIEAQEHHLQDVIATAKCFTYDEFMDEKYEDKLFNMLVTEFNNDFDIFYNLIQYSIIKPYGERFGELARQCRAGVLSSMTAELGAGVIPR